MNDQEVNSVIAKFMGCRFYAGCEFNQQPPCIYETKHNHGYKTRLYTESLDALIPVWELLFKQHRIANVITLNIRTYPYAVTFETYEDYESNSLLFKSEKPFLSESAAHVTAKAIKKLSNESR